MTSSLNQVTELIMAPIPKKAANENNESAIQTNKTYTNDRLNELVNALLKTYKFCMPIGATNANPIIIPFINVAKTIIPPSLSKTNLSSLQNQIN
jgi:hypothetical protein